MRVIVCGGRDYGDAEAVERALSALPITEVAEGGARGADRLAREYALRRGIRVRTYPANWSRFGKAAGPWRNEAMLRGFKPDAVVAFPGGRGTADMTRRATEAGVRVIVVRDGGVLDSSEQLGQAPSNHAG